MTENLNRKVVDGFDHEWPSFDQTDVPLDEPEQAFDRHFSVFPLDGLNGEEIGFDLGCGSGRWAQFIARKVRTLHCIDPASAALRVAQAKLEDADNCQFHLAEVNEIPFTENSINFGYSLGILHHVPDTAAGITTCVQKRKIGAPFLIYLYYAFHNRPSWFRALWSLSDLGRRVIAQAPKTLKYIICQRLAGLVYWPLARTARFAEQLALRVATFALSHYRTNRFYTMRSDALDRFGTRLKQRSNREEIATMLRDAGLERVEFSSSEPFWCALGYQANPAK
ncbi:MAG: ubiquinone/menaquinone biosynthesis C-methylase UbiE [Gammaproteobacteria bacterium]|jgi:ubiquinone/menaquinone biosynthesis C-methylase UbiE